MACLLKAPSATSKGVLVLTTQERDHVVNARREARAAVERVKARWAIGLHHNWHDWAFTFDPLFDFSMAGEDDLREVSGTPFPVLPLDACNFVPAFFSQGSDERFWDVLYIARAVGFKRLPEFLECIRTLYDRGHDYRVLLIAPMPPYKRSDRASVFYELREVYESMFTADEQRRFTLLDISFGYPFPFDLETLAHFYRSSRIFVHFADDERRCRVAAYAWAAGLPVVGMSVVGSLLPPEARRPPAFYEVGTFAEFPDRIVEALEAGPGDGALSARRYVSETDTIPALLSALEHLLGAPIEVMELASEDLGIRLGRHHGLAGAGPNAVPMELETLLELIEHAEPRVTAAMASAPDPELELAR